MSSRDNDKVQKERPPRIFIDKKGRKYIILGKKRFYLKVKPGVSDAKLVEIIINNFKKRKKAKREKNKAKKKAKKKNKRPPRKVYKKKEYPKLESGISAPGNPPGLLAGLKKIKERELQGEILRGILERRKPQPYSSKPEQKLITAPEPPPLLTGAQIAQILEGKDARQQEALLYEILHEIGIGRNVMRKMSEDIRSIKGAPTGVLIEDVTEEKAPIEDKYIQPEPPKAAAPKKSYKLDLEKKRRRKQTLTEKEKVIAGLATQPLSSLNQIVLKSGIEEKKTNFRSKEEAANFLISHLPTKKITSLYKKKPDDILGVVKKYYDTSKPKKERKEQKVKKERKVAEDTEEEIVPEQEYHDYVPMTTSPDEKERRRKIIREIQEEELERELSRDRPKRKRTPPPDIPIQPLEQLILPTQEEEDRSLILPEKIQAETTVPKRKKKKRSKRRSKKKDTSERIELSPEPKKGKKKRAEEKLLYEQDVEESDKEPDIYDTEDDEEVQDPFKKEGSGYLDKGLWNDQIEKMMKHYRQFHGVYAIDELNKVPVSKRFGIIVNLSKEKSKGTHWVAIYIDSTNDMTIDYYDSFAMEPPKLLMKGLRQLINKINPDVYLKFKVNRIKQQSINTDNCGWFCMLFLINRFNGYPFKDCSGYSDVANSERDIERFKKKYEEFGYI